jgi:hypothetical protein
MAPLLETYTQQMWDWGLALHNILQFRGDREYKDILLKVAADFRELGLDSMHREGGSFPPDPHHAFSSLGSAEGFALAAIVAPEKGYHTEAYIATNPLRRQRYAQQYLDINQPHVAYCTLADYVNHLPHVMYAMAQAGAKGGKYTWRELDKMQAFPVASPGKPYLSWQHVIVREDKDQDIAINLVGMIAKGGMPLQVFGADGKKLIDKVIPSGTYSPYRITIPKDGKTGEYSIFVRVRSEKDKDDLRAPLTNLPEVYYTNTWLSTHDWLPTQPLRYFTRSSGAAAESIGVHTHGKGRLLSTDLKKVLQQGDQVDMVREVDAAGMWIESDAGYNWTTGKPIVLAVTPDRWFMPSPEQQT